MATMKFKTNAKCGGCVAAIGAKLNKLVKEDEWSVDLKSPDKVLEVTADKIFVQKGKDKWEINRDAATKVTGDLKVGSKVTIEYKMTATKIDVKEDKKAEKKADAKKTDDKKTDTKKK